jgi:hypothetical protein
MWLGSKDDSLLSGAATIVGQIADAERVPRVHLLFPGGAFVRGKNVSTILTVLHLIFIWQRVIGTIARRHKAGWPGDHPLPANADPTPPFDFFP